LQREFAKTQKRGCRKPDRVGIENLEIKYYDKKFIRKGRIKKTHY
jgi:hypothetical protein